MKALPQNANLFTLDQFDHAVAEGVLTDDSGLGRWATEDVYDEHCQNVQPSLLGSLDVPFWATHVLWV